MPKKPFAVSYSAALSWRTCEAQYWYRYVENIQPRITAPPLALGTFIHDYLETFYATAKRRKPTTEDARRAIHKKALRELSKKAGEIEALAKTASDLGADDQAHTLLAIPQTARDIMRAYYRVHGEQDLMDHRIVMVEQWFQLPIKKGVVLPGKIDLVTENKDGYWLWEHKSTGRIPRADSRFRDLQTLIYVTALEVLYNISVAGIIWNYISTAPPHQPRLLKNGSLSTAKGQTTTRELLRAACKEHELDLKPYRPFLRQVEAKERSDMFTRYTLPVSPSEKVLLRDYVFTVDAIEEARRDKNFCPIRNISLNCNWCPYLKLCQAVILGGDTDVLTRKYFTRKSTQKGGEKNGKEETEIHELLEVE